MNNVLLFTIVFALMGGLIFMPFGGIQGDNGNGNPGINIGQGVNNGQGVANGHTGINNGKGHTNHKGKGLGHVKHHIGVCIYCGGTNFTHNPPCDGTDGGGAAPRGD